MKFIHYIEEGIKNAINKGEDATIKQNLELVRIYLTGSLTGDFDSIQSIYDKNVNFEVPEMGLQLKGIEQVRESFEMFTSMIKEQDLVQVPKVFCMSNRIVINFKAVFVVSQENPWVPIGKKVNESDIQILDVGDSGKIFREVHCQSFTY